MSTGNQLEIEYFSRRNLMARLVDACEDSCPESTTLLRGILLQLDWQWKSGRWAAATLSGSEWWKKANYTLTAWVALAAEKQGLLSLTSAERDQLDPSLDAPAHVLAIWGRFFTAVQTASSVKIDGRQLAELNDIYWMAHDVCLDEIATRFDCDLTKLPKAERRFAGAWISLVRILAKLRFNPGYTGLRWLQSWLPAHALNDAGWANSRFPTRIFVLLILVTGSLQTVVGKQVMASIQGETKYSRHILCRESEVDCHHRTGQRQQNRTPESNR